MSEQLVVVKINKRRRDPTDPSIKQSQIIVRPPKHTLQETHSANEG